ncbi:hypothetical protein E3T61_17290 [Cryobacterium lactosi]|uniref:Uncharacterized protein n=1 Tax=Cryobacterium lactosi TaxID=1259202 RepID=A0A4R9BJB6_9MICO|nr:hypothetical protein [Cryobacterium lactosi]TFD85544.1 hypothetical protein E3T61_17290 [Cryobacterium lactosi]
MKLATKVVTIVVAIVLMGQGVQAASASERDVSDVSAESTLAAQPPGVVGLISSDSRERSYEPEAGFVAGGLAFDVAEGDQFVADSTGQSATLTNAEGEIVLSFGVPELTSEDGLESLPAKFSVIDNVLQVLPLEVDAGRMTLNQNNSCFESWLASFVVGTSGSLLVCLPLGLANVVAGIACTVVLNAGASALDYSKSCG